MKITKKKKIDKCKTQKKWETINSLLYVIEIILALIFLFILLDPNNSYYCKSVFLYKIKR